MQNKKILDYTLLRPLGKGGMAEVWYAENEIGNIAAVKILNPDLSLNSGIVERFRNEAMVTVKLKHPNIRQVYNYSTVDGRPCMVMEYLEGADLSARMKRGERFSETQLRTWWNQLASALEFTHRQGVVHRDIKPSNIFIDADGDVKLLDFGIAKVQEGITMTQTGATMGTLMYMSPEQVLDSKHIGPASDRYSLAMTFVHLLSGKAPYDSATTSDYEIRKGIVEMTVDMAGVPQTWQNFLRPYLAKKPEERPALTAFNPNAAVMPQSSQPANAAEETIVGSATPSPLAAEGTVVETANNAIPPQPSPQAAPPPPQPCGPAPKKPKKKRKRLVIGLVIAALLLAGGGIAVALLMGGGGSYSSYEGKKAIEGNPVEEVPAPEAELVAEDLKEDYNEASKKNGKMEISAGTISLSGTTWYVSNDDYYFYLNFTSDYNVTQYGYYIENGEGYGAWESNVFYSMDGSHGQIYWQGEILAEFHVSNDRRGLTLMTYGMEPYGETSFYLNRSSGWGK